MRGFCMQSTVWFTDLSAPPGKSLLDKTGNLLRAAGLSERIEPGDLTAVKLHFGETGNTAFLRPIFVRKVVEEVAAAGGKPFLTDTNTLYLGGRINADAMVVLTHFKGHELSGFGGAIKNLGMGCASRAGKLAQHSTVSPFVDPANCTGCGTCAAHCPSGAISVLSVKALIDSKTCIGCADCIVVCPEHTVKIDWNEAAPMVQKKMVEHALGALEGKRDSILSLTFVMQISPYCDCYGNSDRPIAPDVGILASCDPVAIDQASADLVIRAAGSDPFRKTHPSIDCTTQLSYGEEMGLGSRKYELTTL